MSRRPLTNEIPAPSGEPLKMVLLPVHVDWLFTVRGLDTTQSIRASGPCLGMVQFLTMGLIGPPLPRGALRRTGRPAVDLSFIDAHPMLSGSLPIVSAVIVRVRH